MLAAPPQIGQESDLGAEVGIVGQPPDDREAFVAARQQPDAAVRPVLGFIAMVRRGDCPDLRTGQGCRGGSERGHDERVIADRTWPLPDLMDVLKSCGELGRVGEDVVV